MKKQLDSLQLYRGIASILVVLHHANIILDRELQQNGSFKIFNFGWIGVDFFFVLSGFIIFYVHRADLGQPTKFRSFISKRFLRIYPLYWIILVGKIILSLFGDKSNSIYQSNFIQFVQAFLLIPQPRANLENFIGVSWTLIYEVFFYILFGIIILIKPKLGQTIIIIWITGLLLNLINLLPFQELFILDFIFSARNLEFIFGCLAAHIILEARAKHGKLLIYSALVILVIAILNTKYHEFDVSGISPVIAYGIPFSMLIIGSVWVEKKSSLKIPPLLIYLGNASYSIYLTHGFFINNITRLYIKIVEKIDGNLLLLPANNIIYMIISSAIVIFGVAIGCIVYQWVEKPLVNIFREKKFG